MQSQTAQSDYRVKFWFLGWSPQLFAVLFCTLFIICLSERSLSHIDNSSVDPGYLDRVVDHISRVRHTGPSLFQMFIANYGPFDLSGLEEVYTSYWSLHDQPKLLTSAELASWGYDPRQPSILLQLQAYDGKKKDRAFQHTIDRLNFYEGLTKAEFWRHQQELRLWPHDEYKRFRESLTIFEHVVDVTLTGYYRFSEFDNTRKLFDGAAYLRMEGYREREIQLARIIEAKLRIEELYRRRGHDIAFSPVLGAHCHQLISPSVNL